MNPGAIQSPFRLTAKAVLFGLLQAAVFGALLFGARRHPDPFLQELKQKHAHAVRSAHPRLLLVGGSNLAFGVQTEMLAAELPFEPTNLGLHAGIGLEFMIADALPEVGRGDLVLLSLEYRALAAPIPTDELWESLLCRPDVAPRLSFTRLADSGFGFIGYITNRGRRALTGRLQDRETGVYNQQSFNAYGDVVAHRGLPPVRPWLDGGLAPEAALGCDQQDLLPLLHRFVRQCESRGARVVLFFPPLPASVYDSHRAELARYAVRMRAEFGDRVLGRIEDVAYPDDDFYDTIYHLRGAGSLRHTRQIIDELRPGEPTARSAPL